MKNTMLLIVLSSCFIYSLESHTGKKDPGSYVKQKAQSNQIPVPSYYYEWPGSSPKNIAEATTEGQSQQPDESDNRRSFRDLVPSQLTAYIKTVYDYTQKNQSQS